MARARPPVSLLVVLVCVLGTLALGAALKAPCAGGGWGDGRQYRHLCYTDIVPLLGTEQLAGGRLPFLDRCREGPGVYPQCDEYPVLSMYFMRVAAWIGGERTAPFFFANVLLLTVCALVVAICLYALGGHPLRFAIAPTLLIYGFMNWDLFTVALATAALLALVRRRDALSGALLGLGAAAKLYPALLVPPFAADLVRRRDPDGAIRLGWAAIGAWLAVNLPIALASTGAWWEFFRFNAARPADWDSLWYIGCRRVQLSAVCGRTGRVDVLAPVLFVVLAGLVWLAKTRRQPDFPRWALGFPVIVVFLLTSKVYSPQYGLWLLPWFALGASRLPAFVAFEAADTAVFVTRFSFFGRISGVGGLPFGAFELAVLIRALVLVWCVVAWVRRPIEALEPARIADPTEAVTVT